VADDAALESVLRLVAEGRLTAEEAGPILDALEARASDPSGSQPSSGPRPAAPGDDATSGGGSQAKALRVEVSQVPGISEATSARIREAIAAGVKGPIVEVDDDGDTVRVSLE